MKNSILGIEVKPLTKQLILEKIKKNILENGKFLHIVSLNPENLVVQKENPLFKKVLQTAQIKIIDGVGVFLGAQFLGISAGSRVTGVNLMLELIKLASSGSLRVLLIGGGPKIADSAVECQKMIYPKLKIKGMQGISNIKKPSGEEEEKIFSIVSAFKPHFIFVAFGSPDQEIWIDQHRRRFGGRIVMGVGGAFDMMTGRVPRAPESIRSLGFEWLFRLLRQPWRIKRQTRLLKFIYLIFAQKWKNKF